MIEENKPTDETNKEEEKNQSKLQILTTILSEVGLFKNKIKSLETAFYKREQIEEAATAEAFLEKEPKKQAAIKLPRKEERDTQEDKKESLFFTIIKGLIPILLAFSPAILKFIKQIKISLKDLPGLIADKFKEIAFNLFESLQNALSTYVFEPIKTFLSENVLEMWNFVTSSIQEAFSSVIGSLSSFLQDNLPDMLKGLIPGSSGEAADGKEPGKQPEINLVGSTGSFGATEGASFEGEYKPSEFGTPAPSTSPAPAPTPSTPAPTPTPSTPAPTPTPSTPATAPAEAPTAPLAATTQPSAPLSAVNVPSAAPAAVKQPSKVETGAKRVTKQESKEPVKQKKAGTQLKGRALVVANMLRSVGITNENAIAAIIATAAKESNLDPSTKELGAKAWLSTLSKRGVDYIYKVFPQLSPGGRVAKSLGFDNGVPAEYLASEWSKGDKAFFASVYKGGEDAYMYRGRGLIQITGKDVYEKVGKEIGVDLVENPDALSDSLEVAGKALGAYLTISIGKGDTKKGLEALNKMSDYDLALKTVVANVGSGYFGADQAKVEAAFTDSGMGKNRTYNLEKAQAYSGLAMETATAQPGVIPETPSKEVQVASTSTQEQPMASLETTTVPVVEQPGVQIAKSSQEIKEIQEKEVEQEKQIIIAAAPQQGKQTTQIGPKGRSAGVKPAGPPADLVQRSYSSYFATV